ncbi:hypothetical protein FRC07_013393, partial [Ceratobasidium sp. 392]
MTKAHSPSGSSESVSSMGVEFFGSDAESVLSLETDKAPEHLFCIPENTDGIKVFAPGDGDFELRINGTVFQTHRYLLKRFSVLKTLIEPNGVELSKSLALNREHSVKDFLNTFKILYASPIDGPPDFDPVTLISALRLATTYDYPALRTFAISNLENAQLSAIERILIAREFEFTSWEEPAYVELCERDEPITEQEANALGVNVFVQVARIREKEQRRRGQQSNDQDEKEGEKAGSEKHEEAGEHGTGLNGPIVIAAAQAILLKKKKEKPARRLAAADNTSLAVVSESTGQANETMGGEATEENNFSPSFIGFSSLDNLRVRTSTSGALLTANALQQLQTHQVAQASSITGLKSSIENINSALTSLKPILDVDEQSTLFELTSVQAAVHKWLYGETQ